MADEDLFETGAVRTRAEVAALFEQLATQVDNGVVHARTADGDHRLELPESVYCEVELEREDAGFELELELTWEV